ncbi:N-acetylglucosaminyl deacetylase, LmbE family [Pseudarcicella hirudinis]|uniref:N-acetylglucosaminyl deacetylase, LmbE family n=1 Tax=Pseudarcicella hirudinis TaxID=1079859 RepID=A0A1I5URS1_9BACT|nr:PIG-L family deacetylase [Pseudarcicella hirudinis]SFP97973.1 N-acetylglucosaminyl deacetylase, LmbE family [Pseudarcicella hirudinis]
MHFKKIPFICLLLLCVKTVIAQPVKPMPAGEILLNLKKLNVLGTAMYMAAHPDDENTIMLSWLAKERKVRTAYLSITRGDGGQNLIGSEQGELLGLIRTQELLAARAIDGPEQYFTRANDFGFSKNTEETLQIWGKDAVLSDVVWRIRNLRPDVIICRFPPDFRAGHGNHSASAYLAEEAFKIAGDPTKFPEQLKYVKPWQPKRVVWNTFNFGAVSQKPTEGTWIPVEIGDFNPLLGKAYTEIAAESRSQHKSQGFGVPRTRGLRQEYLVHKLGDLAQKDLFDGIDLSWGRVKGGDEIAKVLDQTLKNFNPEKPSGIVPDLLKAYQLVNKLEDEYWKTQKKKELEALIIACSGLYFEANPNDFAAAASEKVAVTAIAIKRSDVPVSLTGIRLIGLSKDSTLNVALGNNELQRLSFSVEIPKNQALTQPYYLAQKKMSKGMYRVDDQTLIGLPEKPADLQAEFSFSIEGQEFKFLSPVIYKYTDEVRGELYRPFEIRPEVAVNIADKVYVFAEKQPKNVEVTLKSAKANVSGSVSLELPKGWTAEPASINFSLANKYQEQKYIFKVTPNLNYAEGIVKAVAKTAQGAFDKGILTVAYDHIPPQTLFPPAEAKIVKLDILTKGKNVGYIAGAGDEVPSALRQIGYQVSMITEKELNEDLSKFDAIVVGVRAYNTEERLKYYQSKLMEYVQNGGNMIVQYQVNSNLQKLNDGIGPYPFKLSRDRTTVEEAEMRFLKPDSPLLNVPNKITAKDFDNWVQERGLYFPNEWDSKYEVILSSNDPGEKPSDGGLLYAKYGKGNYVFTGYAFFRQLPAGVSGAYRLFANLISVGK